MKCTRLSSAFGAVSKAGRTQFKRTVSFGISNICQKLIDVPDAFTEASDAISSGHLSRSAEFIQIYHAKDVPELLRLLPAEDVKKFYEATLQSLADRQRKIRACFIRCLFTWRPTARFQKRLSACTSIEIR